MNEIVPSLRNHLARGQTDPEISRLVAFSVLVVLVALATWFRCVDLGSRGFWGDEETTAMPSLALANGDTPAFPSGMEYRRALLHTISVAATVNLFGKEKDASYRIPSALIGIATVLAMFFGVRAILGTSLALVATALVSFSEWHILLSRTARMYGPMLFFAIIFIVLWLESEKRKSPVLAIGAAIAFLVASSLQLLSVMLLPVIVLPSLLSNGEWRQVISRLTVAVALGLSVLAYDRLYVVQPYQFASQPLVEQSQGFSSSRWADMLDFSASYFSAGLGIVALVSAVGLSVWLARVIGKLRPSAENPLVTLAGIASGIGVAVASALGHFYGAGLFLVIMLLTIAPIGMHTVRSLAGPVAVSGALILLWFFVRLVTGGFEDAVKSALRYPFPYLLTQIRFQPGIIVFFGVGVFSCIVGQDSRRSRILRSLAIATLLPVLGLGLLRDWAPERYLLPVYPLVLIIAAAGLLACCTALISVAKSGRNGLATVFAVVVAASGLLGAHGLPQAIAHSPTDYGDATTTMDLYPDHRSPGCFVAAQLREDDIVVAEDTLQQHWYVGRVDVALRDPVGHLSYSYFDEAGNQRDIYVSSLVSTDSIIDQLNRESERRIWVITSAETRIMPDYYLGSGTAARRWLDTIISTGEPVLASRDGLSAVYCLNCAMARHAHDPAKFDCR